MTLPGDHNLDRMNSSHVPPHQAVELKTLQDTGRFR